jgi:hypothetical protein
MLYEGTREMEMNCECWSVKVRKDIDVKHVGILAKSGRNHKKRDLLRVFVLVDDKTFFHYGVYRSKRDAV